MKISRLTPMLYTQQLEATLEFYTQVLGFTCTGYDPSVGWALLRWAETEIMFCPPHAHLPFEKPSFTGSFYFEVEEVDQWWNKLKNHTKVCYEIENFDYGMREFAIYDNNGYLLQFGQSLDKIS